MKIGGSIYGLLKIKPRFYGVVFFISLFLVFFGIFYASASQTDCEWTGGGDNTTWEDALNWSCGLSPNGPQYSVSICNEQAATTTIISLNTSISVGSLSVGMYNGATTSCAGFLHELHILKDIQIMDDDGPWAGDLTIGKNGRINAYRNTVTIERDYYEQGDGSFVFASPNNSNVYATLNFTGNAKFFGAGHYDNITAAYPGKTFEFANGGFPRIGGRFILNGGSITGAQTTTIRLYNWYSTGGNQIVLNSPTNLNNLEGIWYMAAAGVKESSYIAPTIYPTLRISHAKTLDNFLTGSTTAIHDLHIFTFASPGANSRMTLLTEGHDLTVLGNTLLGDSSLGRGNLIINGDSVARLHSINSTHPLVNDEILTVRNGNTIFVTGNWDLKDKLFGYGTSTVHFKNTSPRTALDMNPGTFYNLVLENEGLKSSDDYVIKKDLTILNNLSLKNTGLVLHDPENSSLSQSITIGGDFNIDETSSISYGDTSALVLSGAATINDTTNSTHKKLIIDSEIPGAFVTLASSLSTNELYIAQGGTLDLSDKTLYIVTGGNTTPLVVAGSLNSNTGTVYYKGDEQITTLAPLLYYDLVLDNINGTEEDAPGTFALAEQATAQTITLHNADLILNSTLLANEFINNNGYVNEAGGSITTPSSIFTNKKRYGYAEPITIRVEDSDENISATTTQAVYVALETETDSESFTLIESVASSKVFQNNLSIVVSQTPEQNNGVLELLPNQTEELTITYIDEEDATDIATTTVTINTRVQKGGK